MDLADYRILTFDCYGTLIDWETGILAALRPWLSRTGSSASDDDVLQAYARAESAAERAQPGALYPDILRAAVDAVAAELGHAIREDERDAFAASVGDWPAFPDSATALADLKTRYQLAILSNVDRASFARTNARLGVEFDAVMTAQDIGSYKPDLANFRYMFDILTRRGIERGQILHVAQSLHHDIAPARELGLSCVWIDRRRDRPGAGATPPSDVTADVSFASLAEFARATAATMSQRRGLRPVLRSRAWRSRCDTTR
jgi:2-haloalkanoic acid dehalogenase type II